MPVRHHLPLQIVYLFVKMVALVHNHVPVVSPPAVRWPGPAGSRAETSESPSFWRWRRRSLLPDWASGLRTV